MEHIISYIQESWNFRDSYKTCVKIKRIQGRVFTLFQGFFFILACKDESAPMC